MSEPSGNGNGNTLAGYGAKDPLATSHGDVLLDQNFQSLKSKEVRDSTSPTNELRFHSMTLTQPNTTGWDVQTSSEVSPDGRAYRTETLAKTDGVEKLNGGGVAEFKGRNEQKSSASHQGDDKNFVKQASDSTKTQLQEKVVFGDESSGRTEMKMSSTSTSSSSKVVSSSSSVEFGDEPRYLLDSQADKQQRDWEDQRRQEQRTQEQRHQEHIQRQEQQFRQEQLQEQKFRQEQQLQEQKFRQEQQQQLQEQHQRQEERISESRNVQTQQHYEENKRYVDMDKASPEYQQHVQHLMSQPGEIISNTVEYPKPNVKMITTVKRLPDGTIVKNKRYETEQLTPSQSQTQTQTQKQTHHNQTHNQTQNQTQNLSQNQSHNQNRNQRYVHQDVQDGQVRDVVDNVERQERENVTQSQSFSSVKKSSRRFSTETTSETVEEFDDRGQPLNRGPKPISGHHAPQQHHPTSQQHQSPRQSPGRDFSTHGFPSVRPNKPTQEYLGQRPSTEREQEEVVVVRSEKSRQVKQQTSSQRTTETEVQERDQDQFHPSQTHGFPSVRSPHTQTHSHPDQPDAEVPLPKLVSRNQSGNRERIIETQVEQQHHQQQQHPSKSHSPRQISPRRSQDYNATRSPAGKPSQSGPSGGVTPSRATPEPVTRRQLQKEREVDAAHRAFAASLRSSSPAESTTSTGSQNHSHPHAHHPHHHQQTPRSSISSNRTYRREMREGSHESQAPSETSRISSSTVTRHQTGGNTTKTTRTSSTTTKPTVKSPSEPRSPTPKAAGGAPGGAPGVGGTVTTTTTTTTSTTKTSPSSTPTPAPAPASPDNKLSQYTYTTTKPGDIFSLPPTTPPTINNEPTLTTTTTNQTTTTPNSKPKTNPKDTTDAESQPIRKLRVSTNAAEAVVEEAPCVRRNYYKLGNEGDSPEKPPGKA